MKWMEIIKVQVFGDRASRSCKSFLNEFIYTEKVKGLSSIRYYENGIIDGVHAITLNWSTDDLPASHSDLANTLIHGLKQFGLVDHTIWISPDLNHKKQLEEK